MAIWQDLVDEIIGMGRGLGLCVVAEGVETMDELTFVKSQGCDQAQGYYLGRPVPPDAFGALLDAE